MLDDIERLKLIFLIKEKTFLWAKGKFFKPEKDVAVQLQLEEAFGCKFTGFEFFLRY